MTCNTMGPGVVPLLQLEVLGNFIRSCQGGRQKLFDIGLHLLSHKPDGGCCHAGDSGNVFERHHLLDPPSIREAGDDVDDGARLCQRSAPIPGPDAPLRAAAQQQ